MQIRTAGAVTSVYFEDVSAAWEQWVFLSSDRHHDSMYCNRQLEKKHLDLVKERNALIIDAGDLFDAMQGRFDPRKDYAELRPEYLKSSYYSAVVEDAINFYAPYAANFAVLGRGNHDNAVIRNANIDMLSMLAHGLNREGGNVQLGGYGGYVRFMYTAKGRPRGSLNLKYHHGSGGESRATKGIQEGGQVMASAPDADLILNGHNHQNYIVANRRERLSNKGEQMFDLCYLLRTPGYNDAYGDGTTGWANEKGMAPKTMGGIWLKFTFEDNRPRVLPIPEFE